MGSQKPVKLVFKDSLFSMVILRGFNFVFDFHCFSSSTVEDHTFLLPRAVECWTFAGDCYTLKEHSSKHVPAHLELVIFQRRAGKSRSESRALQCQRWHLRSGLFLLPWMVFCSYLNAWLCSGKFLFSCGAAIGRPHIYIQVSELCQIPFVVASGWHFDERFEGFGLRAGLVWGAAATL